MANKEKSILDRLKQVLGKLASPVWVGVIITGLSVVVSFSHYSNNVFTNAERETSGKSKFMKAMYQLDSKAYDFRLLLRGERKSSGQVAVLTVDERAVSAVGRWPWPREITAKALAGAIENGARVIGFDVVFAEPSAHPAKHFYEEIFKGQPISSELHSAAQSKINSLDSDKYFAEVIEKYSDQMILGTFFEGNSAAYYMGDPLNAVCHKFIFETSQLFTIWENQEVYIAARENEPFIPDTLAEFYREFVKNVEVGYAANHPMPESQLERIVWHERVFEQKINKFCSGWLDPEADEYFPELAKYWPQIKEDQPEETYEEWVSNFKAGLLLPEIYVPERWVMNIDGISGAAKHSGYFNAVLDDDGTIRRSRLLVKSGNLYIPSIGLKTFLVGNDYNAEVVTGPLAKIPGSSGVHELNVTDNETGDHLFSIPVDPQGRLLINYNGSEKIYPHVSLAEMLNPNEEMRVDIRTEVNPGVWDEKTIVVNKKEFLKDKFLIFGATAKAIFDLRVTPFYENYPGVETHATVVDNLLQRDFLRRHPAEEMYMFLALSFLGIILSVLLSRLSALPGLIITSSVIGLIALVDKYFLFGEGLVVSIILPILLVGSIYVSMTFYKYFTEEKNKKELRGTFQKYVSPSIVEEILSDPSNIELGGQKQNITVLFSDIRGFTTISEKLDPKVLSDLLNMYLTPMTDLVFSNRGTLDKYMGDAIMAFFGAPIPYDGHAKHACRCALQQIDKLKELQKEFAEKGLPRIDIGIGLNTGDCSVGNMGSETVRSYTVMGDAVNLGSRLEGITKQYGVRIIISEFTQKEIKDEFVTREVDWVRVKGKVLPVKIFELITEGTAPKPVEDLLSHFNDGYRLYRQKKFQKALECFSKALNINPEDQPSKLYMERCHDFLNTPPPEDWDGVFVMKTK